jgi:peptide/nickel transport system permease protein
LIAAMAELLQFLRGSALAVFGLVILSVILLGIALAPLIVSDSPIALDIARQLRPPGWANLLGTDYFGRDVLARVLHGGRATLVIGIGVVAIAFVAGVPFGILAGYFGGAIDMIIMRVVDAMLSFPALVLAIALAAAFGPIPLRRI